MVPLVVVSIFVVLEFLLDGMTIKLDNISEMFQSLLY